MDKPVISEYERKQNELFHKALGEYGAFGYKWAKGVRTLIDTYNLESVLDYGAGKRFLEKELPVVKSYDPAFAEIAFPPAPADLVVSTHVLEHIEPDLLDNVLEHIHSLTRKVFLIVVNSGPSKKFLPDGRDSNLIQKSILWWYGILAWEFSGFRVVNINRGEFIKSGKIIEDTTFKTGNFIGVSNEI